MKKDQTEVLVVGAGPVGLLTAILLAERDIQVQIIDSEERTAARSYACALHPATFRMLDHLGLGAGKVHQARQHQQREVGGEIGVEIDGFARVQPLVKQRDAVLHQQGEPRPVALEPRSRWLPDRPALVA